MKHASQRLARIAASLCLIAAIGGAATTANAGAQISKPQFIAKADAICGSAIVKISKLGRLYPASRAASVGAKILAVDRRTLAALRALTPPAGEAAKIKGLLGLTDKAINTGIAGVVTAARSGSNDAYLAAARRATALINTAHKAARRYGFSTCARW
jgi:hypothetical protein